MMTDDRFGPPQGGRGLGRGYAAPSKAECTMNRAPTMVRPAANKYPQHHFRFPVSLWLLSLPTANRFNLLRVGRRLPSPPFEAADGKSSGLS